MYLFIRTETNGDSGGWLAIAKHGPRSVRTGGVTPQAAAMDCAVRFFFGNGGTAESARKVVLVETFHGQFMARLAGRTDLVGK